MENILNKRKGQQEIIGFVMVVLLVVIAGVIFLGISLQKGQQEIISTEDAEISNFLISSTKYTSDCEIRKPLYADVNDLIKACNDNDDCSDGRNSCEVLEEIYEDMTNIIWPAGADRPVKYTRLSIYYSETSDAGEIAGESFIEIESGDEALCGNKRAGDHRISQYPGNLVVNLEICV